VLGIGARPLQPIKEQPRSLPIEDEGVEDDLREEVECKDEVLLQQDLQVVHQ
jgi:hypothetical protein